ncbi:hypothetical protein Celaphus_00012936 [Cervus elaphus hippelaphus]|uniref:Uncharacterized protein n=1 Tax=Cervus elaphus hippelaphus TaxID=46360 RepID=A0A212CI26_CEREH|nr:hypothetical protein Celaphus_00012936 [Cervus elaphus hippelaphus]
MMNSGQKICTRKILKYYARMAQGNLWTRLRAAIWPERRIMLWSHGKIRQLVWREY